MNTIAVRKDELDKVMKEFEKDRSMAWVAGFYAAIVRELATDQLRTYEQTKGLLERNTVKRK